MTISIDIRILSVAILIIADLGMCLGIAAVVA